MPRDKVELGYLFAVAGIPLAKLRNPIFKEAAKLYVEMEREGVQISYSSLQRETDAILTRMRQDTTYFLQGKKLSLSIDGGSRRGEPGRKYYAVCVSDGKDTLMWSLKEGLGGELNPESGMDPWLLEVVKDIEQSCAGSLVVSICSDNEQSVINSIEYVREHGYPHIINMRCLAHGVALIVERITKIVYVQQSARFADLLMGVVPLLTDGNHPSPSGLWEPAKPESAAVPPHLPVLDTRRGL